MKDTIARKSESLRQRNSISLVREFRSKEKLTWYMKQIKVTLLGWQPKVILLNRFVTDLAEELKSMDVNISTESDYKNLQLIEKMVRRDIDYVADIEYIECIKFILEFWQPELTMSRKYVKHAYDALGLENIPFENHLGFIVEEFALS